MLEVIKKGNTERIQQLRKTRERNLSMKLSRTRCLIFSMVAAVLCSLSTSFLSAQTLHRFGQSVQPIYEGFERNSDGSYTMWFGYLNRNYDETPNVPIGINNSFQVAEGVTTAGQVDQDLILLDPGPPDRGQPTYFYPRRQQFVFGIHVQAGFVGKELIWSVSHNGETSTAIGTLERENIWAVDEGVWGANRGRGTSGRTEIEYVNQPPAVRMVGVEGQLFASIGRPLTLRVFASDDGLPGPYERERRRAMESLPNNLPTVGGGIGRNSPKSQSVVNYVAADETGLGLTWIMYRVPGQVHFDSPITALRVTGEETITTATFSQPGTYELRAYADDGAYTRSASVTVEVR